MDTGYTRGQRRGGGQPRYDDQVLTIIKSRTLSRIQGDASGAQGLKKI